MAEAYLKTIITLCELRTMSVSKKHVLLIAGPSACGKSTLISGMLRDRDVAKRILTKVDLVYKRKLGKLNLQRLVNHEKLSKNSPKNKIKIVLVQFDILSRYHRSRRLELEEVIDSAKSVRFLILYLPFKKWLQRMNQRCNYHPDSNPSFLSACAGFFCAGSKCSRPSHKAWLIVMASRFSAALGQKMYRSEYLFWHDYWLQHLNVPLFYFDSCLGNFSEELPCYD